MIKRELCQSLKLRANSQNKFHKEGQLSLRGTQKCRMEGRKVPEPETRLDQNS